MVLGNFDGVHLGHQSLLELGLKWKKKAPAERALEVLTFNPHPTSLLRPPYFPLFDLKDRVERLHFFGAEKVHIQNFDLAFSKMTAVEFVEIVIKKQLQANHIITGENFFFGHNREGNSEKLKEISSKLGLTVEIGTSKIIEKLERDGSEIISTSKIKEALTKGQVDRAEKMLGRPYYLKGVVVAGDKRGRTIGFPTANVIPEFGNVLSRGVYCGWVDFGKGEKKLPAVANLGIAPTVRDSATDLRLEVHLIDFNRDVYGQEIRFDLVQLIRFERKMSGLEELKNQIKQDVNLTRQILGIF